MGYDGMMSGKFFWKSQWWSLAVTSWFTVGHNWAILRSEALQNEVLIGKSLTKDTQTTWPPVFECTKGSGGLDVRHGDPTQPIILSKRSSQIDSKFELSLRRWKNHWKDMGFSGCNGIKTRHSYVNLRRINGRWLNPTGARGLDCA